MKILIILPRFPYPLEKGDKLRAYHQIRVLSSHNDIYLFALSHTKVRQEDLVQMEKYCKRICVARISGISAFAHVVKNFFLCRSLQIGCWESRAAKRKYAAFESETQPDIVYAQMVRTMIYPAHSKLPKVLDFQDALSMNTERKMLVSRGFNYFLLHFEFKMLRSAEFTACNIFDATTIISETDRDAIPRSKDKEVEVVANGVDFDYFRPIEVEKEYDVVFCGNMQYKPNVDAVIYLVNDIMPVVWKTNPDSKVLIAGATPTASIRALANDRVEVTGTVDDIRKCYAQSKIFVAPMRLGSGLQNKLLEAMSMRVPCVTTSIANSALGAENGRNILIGDNVEELSRAILSLMKNDELRVSVTDSAERFVHDNFAWDKAVEPLERILHSIVEKHVENGKQSVEDK